MKRNSPASPSARIRAATTNSSLRRLILSIRAFEGSRNDLNNKPIRQNRRPKNFPMSRQCVTVRHSRNIICYVAALLRLGNRAMFRPAGSHQLRIGVIGRSEERSVGKELVGTCGSRGARYHQKKKKKTT